VNGLVMIGSTFGSELSWSNVNEGLLSPFIKG
jgi:hypothetical protein